MDDHIVNNAKVDYYAPPLIGGALSDAFVWRLSVCCVHRTKIETREA